MNKSPVISVDPCPPNLGTQRKLSYFYSKLGHIDPAELITWDLNHPECWKLNTSSYLLPFLTALTTPIWQLTSSPMMSFHLGWGGGQEETCDMGQTLHGQLWEEKKCESIIKSWRRRIWFASRFCLFLCFKPFSKGIAFQLLLSWK